jgi:4-amino-4-deoxy-L-arabinose transferase-like glycosyltransferase
LPESVARAENPSEPAVGAAFSRVAESTPASALVLVFLGLLMFAPGQVALPLTDRDEARFVQATRQMHQNGDYIDIRHRDDERYKKPIGIYWLQAVATAPFGGAEAPVWAYQLPSLLGGIASVLAVWAIGRSLFDRRTGLVAALLFLPTVAIAVEARLATIDAALAASVLLCQAALASAWCTVAAGGATAGARLSWRRAMSFWFGLGAGILLKGPVAPMIVGLAGAALSARIRSPRLLLALRPLAGVFLAAAIVLPWVAAITFVSKGEFLRSFVGRELLVRASEGLEGHGAPPGTHVAVLFVLGWPMAAFLVLAIPTILRRWREPAVFFCLAWLAPAWLVFETAATKLPHYTLPLYPALALLTATAIIREGLSPSRALRLVAGFLLVGLPLAAAIGVAILPRVLGDAADPLAVATVAVAALAALAAAVTLWRGRTEHAILAAVLSAALLYAGAISLALPKIESLWISQRLVALMRSSAGCTDPSLAAVGYDEPSLIVAGGASVGHLRPEPAAEWLKEPGCRLIAVSSRQLRRFRAAVEKSGVSLRGVGEERTYRYPRGHFLTLHFFVPAPAAE